MPLADLLSRAKLKPEGRYVVFHCADTMDQGNALEGGGDGEETDEAPTGNANPSMTKQSGGDESRKDSGGQQATGDDAASAERQFGITRASTSWTRSTRRPSSPTR